jgi:hypothetical protein
MNPEKKKTNPWWPDVSTPEQAKAAAMGGSVVALIVAVVTGAVTLYATFRGPFLGLTPWSFLDVFFFALIAFGIRRLSRVAAVAGLVLYLIEQVVQWTTSGFHNPFVMGIFTLYLIHAVRGTFSYHRMRALEQQAGPAGNIGTVRPSER